MATRLSHGDLDACSRALQELYAVTSSLAEFPDRLLPLLAQLVPSGHISYNDFSERHNRFVIRYFPARPEAQKLLPQFTKHFHTHPLHEHFLEPGTFLGKISDTVTLRQFKDRAIYQEYYRKLDTRHQMVLFLPNENEARVGLALNRERRDFSERDRSVLEFLSPHIAQAHRNTQVSGVMAMKLQAVGEGLDSMHRAVIIAGADAAIHWLSPLACEWLQEFFPGFAVVSGQLPSPLAIWLEKIEKSSRAGQPVFSQLQLPAANRSRLLVNCGKAKGQWVMLLTRERMEIDQTAAEALGLTPREAEILYWLSEAKTRPEIAAILGVSCRTIGKHLEHIFTKLRVENRLQAQRIGRELRRM